MNIIVQSVGDSHPFASPKGPEISIPTAFPNGKPAMHTPIMTLLVRPGALFSTMMPVVISNNYCQILLINAKAVPCSAATVIRTDITRHGKSRSSSRQGTTNKEPDIVLHEPGNQCPQALPHGSNDEDRFPSCNIACPSRHQSQTSLGG